MKDFSNIKEKLYATCLSEVQQKIATLKKSMVEIQEAANLELKSSAGDKYETGRSMMQLEKEKLAAQLNVTLKLEKTLMLIKPDKPSDQIQLGSVVRTTNGNFYISISLGKITIDNIDFFIISPVSPLGGKFLNKEVKETVKYNGREFTILGIH